MFRGLDKMNRIYAVTVLQLLMFVSVKGGRCQRVTNSSPTEEAPKPEIHLLVFAPYPDPDAPQRLQPRWATGPVLMAAADLAVELINNRTDLLSGYDLSLIEGDSGCNELSTKALLAYTQAVFHSGKCVVGVVGPYCSSNAMQIAPLVIPERAAMIHVTIATSPALTDREEYPNTFLAISSSRTIARAIVELARANQWTRFGALYDGLSTYHLKTFLSLTENLQVCNMSGALEYHSIIYDFYFNLQEMKDSRLRIFLILAGPQLASMLLCLALHDGDHQLLFPARQWIFMEVTVDELAPFENVSFTYETQYYSCSRDDLKLALEGAILLYYDLVTDRLESETVSERTYNEYNQLYRKKVNERLGVEEIPTDLYSHAYHDAVWAIALALNASIENGVILSDYHPGRKDITETVRQKLVEVVEFQGVSGMVKFDSATGQTNRPTDFLQVQAPQCFNKSSAFIGHYDPTQASPLVLNGSFVEDSFETNHKQISVLIFTISIIATSLQLTAIVAVHVANAVYQDHSYIKASSPRLNHLMYLGSYFLVLVLVELLILGYSPPSDDTAGTVLCNSLLCFTHLGLTLILVTICVKLWRIYRIFVHSWKPGKHLYNRVLAVAILLLVLPVLLYCLVRFTLAPLTLSSTETFQEDGGLPYIEITKTCHWEWYDTTVLHIYDAAILGSALYFSLATRHVSASFRTTRSTSMLIYSLILIDCIGIPLHLLALLLSWDLNVSYSIQCVTYNCVLFVCFLFGFVPPLIPLIRQKLKFN